MCMWLASCTKRLLLIIAADPVRYRCFPTIYRVVAVIYPSIPGCGLFQSGVLIECLYSVVLGDGVTVPSPPDLNSDDYVGHFIAWERDSMQRYVDFDFSGIPGVTAIELSFLNSPASGISLPDILLYRVQYGSLFATNTVESIILDNQHLSQTDNEIRTVTIQPLQPIQATDVRVAFQFTDFHNFDWIFLSEIRFCIGEQLNFTPNIQFSLPPSTIVQPSADNLRGGSTELVCTVSSQGSYTWQWEKDDSVIGNGDPSYDITIGDGSRTTKLVISNLDFSDAGQYRCTATIYGFDSTLILVQTIQFPGIEFK